MKDNIKKGVAALLTGVILALNLCGCGSEQQNAVKTEPPVVENATRVAEIDLSRDNTASMPTTEEVISGGMTKEFVETFEGENAKAALTVNGEPVSQGILQFSINNKAMAYAQSLMYMDVLGDDISAFDWNTKDPNFDGSYLDYAKNEALKDIIARFALVAEGKRRGIVLTDEDKNTILKWVDSQQKGYSDYSYTGVLNQNGCPSIDAFIGYHQMNLLEARIIEDFYNNPEKYAPKDLLLSVDKRDLVTVKHILIAFNPNSPGGAVTDEMKASAKAEAEEVLAKVNAGEDFDALMEQYTDDSDESKKGYTFADDGTMVQEFTDASFALKVGETSGLVETSYGYHIIRRLDRAVNITDYLTLLSNNAKVVFNSSIYNNMGITADIEMYLNTVKQNMGM